MGTELATGVHQGVSRRRVVHTAVWAAPAILIATSLPAAAASQPPVATALALNSLSLTRALSWSWSTLQFDFSQTITGAVAVSGGSASAITLKVALPSNAFGANSIVVTSGSAWQLTGSTSSGSIRTFTFTYSQTVQPGGTTSTLSATATMTFANYRKATTATFTASATGSPVPQVSPVSSSVSLPRA